MAQQKQAVIELVASHRSKGRTVGEEQESVGVARSSYYRWKRDQGEKNTIRTEFVRDNGRGTKTD